MQLDKNITNTPGIYKITNLVNSKFYIGSSVMLRTRLNNHKLELKKNVHANKYLQNAWNKYGETNFKVEIVELVPREEFIDNNYLTDIEQMYLDSYQPYREEVGYNLCKCAGSTLGFRHSEESRKKFSEQRKGKKSSKIKLYKYTLRILSNEIAIDIRLRNTKRYRFGGFSSKEEAVNYAVYLGSLNKEEFIKLGEVSLQLRSACGYHGVIKQDGRYISRVTFQGQKYYLGMYSTALEAALVYNNFVIINNINRPLNIVNLNG